MSAPPAGASGGASWPPGGAGGRHLSRQGPPRRRRGRAFLSVAIAGVLVAGAAGGIVVFDEDADHGDLSAGIGEAGGGEPGGSGDAEATTAALSPDASPADVFDHASAVLDAAGTFSYEASTRVEGSDEGRGFGAIVLDSNHVGDVILPDSLRETVDDAQGGQSERIVMRSGSTAQVWRRQTAFAGQLESRPWGEDEPWQGELDPYRLPEWLEDVVDARDGGEDSNGRRVVHANVPVAVIGEGPRFGLISAAVELTITEEGDPRHVRVELATADLVIETDYSLSDLGGEVAIEPPPRDQLDPTPWFNEEDLAAYEGPAPLGLNPVPQSWVAVIAEVVPDPSGECTSVAVAYQETDDEQRSLLLQTMPAGCTGQPAGDPLAVAGFSGAVTEAEPGTWVGAMTSGDTAVELLTNLTGSDLEFVLSTLGPLDLAATPIGAPPTDA